MKLLHVAALSLAAVASGCGGGSSSGSAPQTPNILFVIMDDVGVDQMKSFGYGGATPPHLPNMDAIARAGVRFRNTWSMPECSPGRAAFFTGRYPFRTGVYQATGPNDLANSQLSPYDVTVPKLLRGAGYESGMFGKFHLAGPEHNEAGHATPAVLGWDHFHGWIGGLPASIDTTLGGLDPSRSRNLSCGFDLHHLAGSCHFADKRCENMSAPPLHEDSSGLQCVAKGGLFVDDHVCGDSLPAGVALDFNKENAYYVSPLLIIDKGRVEQVPLDDPRSRGYRTTIEADGAIAWIKSRPAGKPWMATVSFSAAHTPWQFAPKHLTPLSSPGLSGNVLDCANPLHGRAIQNQMTEAMDTEFGRILVEAGLASRASDGSLQYDPKASNTVIVIAGDNGSLGFAVKQPFNTQRAKGSAYQTGVWVPLIVAGPQVEAPDRAVNHMVNAVDLFQFFGELAGVDAHREVPRTLDSVGLLAYLKQPGQASLRSVNFSMSGTNTQAGGGRNGACVVSATSCTQVPVSKSVCEDNAGVWWGAGYSDASVVPNGGAGYQSCCRVNQALHKAGAPGYVILPEVSTAIRDASFKFVRDTTQSYDAASDSCSLIVSSGLYAIDQQVPTPALDDPDRNLLLAPLSGAAQASHVGLQAKLDEMLASEPPCPGDGNRDGVVDARDLSEWRRIASDWGLSSVYDFFFDGRTDAADGQIIEANMGTACPRSHGVY
jgi:hypothetical protein